MEYENIVEIGVIELGSRVVLTKTQQKRMKEQRLKDLKAKTYNLFQAIDRLILETILNKDNSNKFGTP